MSIILNGREQYVLITVHFPKNRKKIVKKLR
jgi:hypothetical protein